MTFQVLTGIRVRLLPSLLLFLMTTGFFCKAHCQTRSKSLDSSTVNDLSLSLFRDNYDIWAGEMINNLLVENMKQLAPIEEQLAKLSESEKSVTTGIRKRLLELYQGPSVDETSVRAAILLSRMSAQEEKLEYLRSAVRMAQAIAPGSVQTLRVALLYLAELLATGRFSDAARFKAKVVELAEQSALRGSHESCLAFVLSGDVDFQESQFGVAEESYQKASACEAKTGSKDSPRIRSFIQLRRVWSSYRLMKYNETLRRIDQLVAISEFKRDPLSPALKTDLSVMLAVSMSELALALPPTTWVEKMGRDAWIADALVKTVKYLLQKDQFETAVHWVEALEPHIMTHTAALDFFTLGIEAFEKSGAIESSIEFRSRAAMALHPREPLARATGLDTEANDKRKNRLLEWSRSVIDQRADQDARELSKKAVTSVYRIAEGLYEDRGDACSQLPILIKAQKIISGAIEEPLAERIFGWFKNCNNLGPFAKEVTLNRMEMYREVCKRSPQDSNSWATYIDLSLSSLESFKDEPEVRRIALEAITDAIERHRSEDAEKLFLLQLLTLRNKSESSQWEIDGLVSASVRLLAREKVSPQMEAAAWFLLSRLSESSSSFDVRRRQLEAMLASHVTRLALNSRTSGRLQDSVDVLAGHHQRFADDSAYGRDLLFLAVQIACLSGLENGCLSLSEKFQQISSQSAHDLFLVSHWRAEALIRAGLYFPAAEQFLNSFQMALDSQRDELIKIAKDDLVRAGDIFVQLKFWNEALLVRSALTKVSSLAADSRDTYNVLMRWSLLAVRDGFVDVAAAMSADLGAWIQAGLPASNAPRKLRLPELVVGRLLEAFTKSVSSAMPPAAYKTELMDALVMYRDSKGVLLRGGGRLNDLAVQMLVTAVSRWERGLMDESEVVSRTANVGGIEGSLRYLNRSLDEIVKTCRLLEGHRPESACLSEVSVSFKRFAERINASLIRIDGSQSVDLRVLDAKLISFQAKVSALGVGLKRRGLANDLLFGGIVERRGRSLGILTTGVPSAGGAR